MSLVFDKNLLGSREHVPVPCCDISVELPRIGSEAFSDLARLYSISIENFPSEPFRAAYKTIAGDSNVPWELCMPSSAYEKEKNILFNNVIRQIETIQKNVGFSYYETYKSTEKIFDHLKPAKIDIEKYDSYLCGSDKTGLQILKTFNPGKDGFSSPTSYSRSDTITGRLKVIDGPNILHLKKDFRDILVSRWGQDGTIVYMDYKSLEPRTLLNLITSRTPYIGSLPLIKYSGKIPPDIYTHLINELRLPSVISRDLVKTAIISLLYGATKQSVVYSLKEVLESPGDLVDLVTEYFGLEELKLALTKRYVESDRKYILNHYDKPIFCENTVPSTLVNYYIQSTAVDIALLGFNQIVDWLAVKNLLSLVIPIYVLHDALILDVHNSIKPHLTKLASLGEDIPGFNNKFFLDVALL